MERKTPYVVGNVYCVDFGQSYFQSDSDSSDPIVYGIGHSHENTRPISLKVGINGLYAKARDEQRFSDVDCLVTLVLGLTKLLYEEEEADGEGDGYESAVIALRLATVEVKLAVHEWKNRPITSQTMAEEALIRDQQLVDCSDGELFIIEDGDQLVFIPTSIHIRMGIVYKLLGRPEKTQQCFEEAENGLDRLFTQEQEGVKDFFRQMISDSRVLDI